jgi:hypothetical protein
MLIKQPVGRNNNENSGLAIYDCGCSCKIEKAIPCNLGVTDYYLLYRHFASKVISLTKEAIFGIIELGWWYFQQKHEVL